LAWDRDRRTSSRPSAVVRGPAGRLVLRPDASASRQVLVRRLVSVVVLLVAGGAVVALVGGPDRIAVAEGYTQAWARGDFRAMYAQLTRGRHDIAIVAPPFRRIRQRG